MMTLGRPIGIAAAALCLAGLLHGDTPKGIGFTISSHANIYGAGLPSLTPMPSPSGGGGGIPPVRFNLPAGNSQVITFAKVSGAVDFGNASAPTGADGGNFGYQVAAHRGISSFQAPVVGCLVGVFLDDNEPDTPAPEGIDFASDGIHFAVLSPKIGQVFFIGDGIARDGIVQQFHVPPLATRLFLGFADAYYSGAGPGYYGDNTGEISVTLNVFSKELQFPKVPKL